MINELKWRTLYWTYKTAYKIQNTIDPDELNTSAYGVFADKIQTYLVKDITGYRMGRDFKYLGEFPLVNDYKYSEISHWNIEDEFFDAIYHSKNYNEMMFNFGAIKFELDMITLYYNREWEDLTKQTENVA